MSIAPAMETLKRLVGELGECDADCFAALVQAMRALERSAAADHWHALAKMCRSGAQSVEALARSDRLEGRVPEVLAHLQQIVVLAERSIGSIDSGTADNGSLDSGTNGTPMATPVAMAEADPAGEAGITTAIDDDERLFAETVELFVANAQGTLMDLEQELIALPAGQPGDEQAVAVIRRIVHTMKAEFGVLGMAGPQALCHQAETTIDLCVDGGIAFPVDLLLAVRDRMQQFVERLAADVRAGFGDAEPLLWELRTAADAASANGDGAAQARPVPLVVAAEFAHELPTFLLATRAQLELARAASAAALAAVGEGDEARGIEQLGRAHDAFQAIGRVARFLDLAPLRDLTLATAELLVVRRAPGAAFGRDDAVLVGAAAAMTGQLLDALDGGELPAIGPWRSVLLQLHTQAGRRGLGSVAAEARDGEAEPIARAPHREPPVPAPRQQANADRASAPPAASAAVRTEPLARVARTDRTVRVRMDRLDALVDLVGELVIAQSMVLQDPAVEGLTSEALTRNIGRVGKIARELQTAAMSLRMVSIKATCQKMARLVRDVAGKSGKDVALSIIGEHTELDRHVVEQIGDPLVHLIRNAIDHGIEAPDVRARLGKDPQGHLTLRAYHQGGSIVIELQDDGRGIDRERLLAQAILAGLLPRDATLHSLPPAELDRLIFRPGLSTAIAVTELSGRGVGMAVVEHEIESLRGSIEIDSAPGLGTTFRLRLPLTLALIDGMVVRVGSSCYVVPTVGIEYAFLPARGSVCLVPGRGECVQVRGAVLPVLRLKQVFGLREGCDELQHGILLVVESNAERSCLFVDEVLGQQQVLVKSLGVPRAFAPGLAGGAIMTDGRVALVVDLLALLDSPSGRGNGA